MKERLSPTTENIAFTDLHQQVDFTSKIYENHDLYVCSKLYFQVTHSPKQGVFQGVPLRPPVYQIEFNKLIILICP